LWYAKNGGTDYIKEPFASWVGVPMIAGDAVLGVIATYHKTLDYVYTRDDQEILSLLANQAAVALENARLYADLEERTQQLQKRTQELEDRTRQVLERNRQLAALQAIGVKMTSQLDLTEVLGSITEQANAIMSASFATLFPYDAAQDQFEAGYRKGHADVEPSIPSNSGFTARIVKTRQPMFVEDALNEPGVKRTFIEGKGVKSFAAVPLIMKDKVLGVLYVNYLATHTFSSDERETLSLLGNQAAVAIENARLYTEMEQRVVERTQAWQTARDEAAVAERKRLDAEKWAELGKTAGSLAHRIGNKGGIIRVSIGDVKDRLREQGIQDEVLLEKVETIARNNEYLLEMSDLLFKPVQASTAETTRMSLGLLLAEAIKSAEIPQEVQVEVGAGVSLLPDVPANRSFVEVFTEIIINALTAMEASPQKVLTIDGRVVNDSVEISFADTGSGIPDDKLERLFDLFTQLSDKPIGAGRRGFGLWWVRSFLSSIGGEIMGKSELDSGSVFTIRLPLKR
jgi:GAF domain-containing protein